MGNGVQSAMGYRGYGVQEYRPHGQLGTAGNQVQGFGAHGRWGTGQVMCQNVKRCQVVKKTVKCQKNQTPRLWRRFTKNKLTQ